MHQRKSSKKKVSSTFATSTILAVCLLPDGAHAEERSVQKKQVQYGSFQTIDGKSHYFSGDGTARMMNSWLADYNQDGQSNTWYILDKGEMASGFQTIDGKTYYFDPNNDYRMAKDWFKIGEDWYRTNEDGVLNKGILSKAKRSARRTGCIFEKNAQKSSPSKLKIGLVHSHLKAIAFSF